MFPTLVPEEVLGIVLADRGFGRTELARTCQQLGFPYVIRIKPEVWIRSERFCGKLADYPVKKGICGKLANVRYRKQQPLKQHVVVCRKPRLPKDWDECWFLMTELDWLARQIVELYGLRMRIEEAFTDHKNRRNGWVLRNIQLRSPERFDCLGWMLAVAYLLLVGLGYWGRQRYCPSTGSSNTRVGDCSAFTMGRCLPGCHVQAMLGLRPRRFCKP